jgi:hypothetical protein
MAAAEVLPTFAVVTAEQAAELAQICQKWRNSNYNSCNISNILNI